tara:strand:- start:2855 stop:3832 length:978 start_codon:yes stop_codon:yes gene_type:complete
VSGLLGRGYSGGHITLIFTVEDEADELTEQGSLGAGICLKDGVEVITRGIEGEGRIEVSFFGNKGDSGMYIHALQIIGKILPEILEYDWEVTVKLGLPTGQGFGMSAAGSIAFCDSLQRAVGIPYEESKRRSLLVAHLVDRERSSGLGDVTALATGGVVIRKSPGSPYSGHLLDRGPGESVGWSSDSDIILTWNNQYSKHTSTYIEDSEWKSAITKSGNKNLRGLLEGVWDNSRWHDLVASSESFSLDSGLSGESARANVLNICKSSILDVGMAEEVIPLLCMLGTSVAIVPRDINYNLTNPERIVRKLNENGLTAVISRIGQIL